MDTGQKVPTQYDGVVGWMRDHGVRRLRTADYEIELDATPILPVGIDDPEDRVTVEPEELEARTIAGMCLRCGANPVGGLLEARGLCRICSLQVVHGRA
jgi:hypothetical protein